MKNVTDIVVTTRNRLGYLQTTLEHIFSRTNWPFRLHVIDDGSEDGTAEWLAHEYLHTGKIHTLTLRNRNCGAAANMNLGVWSAFSDPVVFVDDDVLCPRLTPCWLTQMHKSLNKHLDCTMLCLNHPGAKYKITERAGDINYCKSIGGTFVAVRREFLLSDYWRHEEGFLGPPWQARCIASHRAGKRMAHMADVYCYHIGKESVLTGGKYQGRDIPPFDWDTLAPSKRIWARSDTN